MYYGFQKIKNYNKKNNKKYTVGFIGRFDLHKGVHTILKVFETINKKKFILKIAGSGDLFNFFCNKYKKYKNIIFLGRIKNVYRFLSSVDCLWYHQYENH